MDTPTIHLGLTAGRARHHVDQAFYAARQPMPVGLWSSVASWHRASAPDFRGCNATGLVEMTNAGHGSATGTSIAVKCTPNAHTRPLGARLT